MDWLAVLVFGLAVFGLVVRYELQMRAILKRLDEQESRLDAEVEASVHSDEILETVEINVTKILHGGVGMAGIGVPVKVIGGSGG